MKLIVPSFNTEGSKLLTTLKGHNEIVTTVAWSANGEFLATASFDHQVFIWKKDVWSSPWQILKRHTSPVLDLCWSPDGILLASGHC